MHELALSRAIVATAVRHAEGLPVKTVHVRLGSLRQAVPESLAFYFAIAAEGGGCAGAGLEIEPVAALLRCPSCGREWDPAPAPLAAADHPDPGAVPPVPVFGCPDCGAGGVAIAGEELEVDWIEVDERAAAVAEGPG